MAPNAKQPVLPLDSLVYGRNVPSKKKTVFSGGYWREGSRGCSHTYTYKEKSLANWKRPSSPAAANER